MENGYNIACTQNANVTYDINIRSASQTNTGEIKLLLNDDVAHRDNNTTSTGRLSKMANKYITL